MDIRIDGVSEITPNKQLDGKGYSINIITNSDDEIIIKNISKDTLKTFIQDIRGYIDERG